MTILNELHARRKEILALGAKSGLTDIRVFGSVARGEETDASDIDILVNVADANDPLAFVDFQNTMSAMFSRKVDIVFERGLYALLRQHILQEAKPL